MFGPLQRGKLFEPESIHINNLVLKEALELNDEIGQYFWVGVRNKDYKYMSTGLPISISNYHGVPNYQKLPHF